MPQKLKIDGPATPEEVTAARRTHPNPHDQERLLTIQMAQQGPWKSAERAAACCRGTATIGRWLKKFRHGGIPERLKRDHGARQAQLDAAAQDALKAGLKEGKWKTAEEIRHWLSQEQGKTLSVPGVYSWRKSAPAANCPGNGMPSKPPSRWKPSSKTWSITGFKWRFPRTAKQGCGSGLLMSTVTA